MSGTGTIAARVKRLDNAGEDILRVVLKPEGADRFPGWAPGAHIDLVLPIAAGDGEPVVRQYSLCSDPQDLSEYQIAVLRDPNSRGGSSWIHDQLKEGGPITIGMPRNHFPFQPGQRTLFIAGGIGITPILPMARQAEAEGRDWRMVVAVRSRQRLPLGDDLAGLPQERIHYHFDEEAGLLDLASLLAPLGSETIVYSCGPKPLLNALQERNSGAPWQFRFERFAAEPVVTGGNRPFDIICRSSGKRLHVPADKSILQVLREAGIKVESSCRDGVCGTCEVRVLSGTLEHRDSVLTPEEREEGGYMMVCVSRAVSDVLELDI